MGQKARRGERMTKGKGWRLARQKGQQRVFVGTLLATINFANKITKQLGNDDSRDLFDELLNNPEAFAFKYQKYLTDDEFKLLAGSQA
jgi:hypothetical protein